ncbi:MAG: hypothetical protein M0024_01265 [Nitrospiraceae bacterium]|nr:hypothetical protein [Nitrospiraceae bacterium]
MWTVDQGNCAGCSEVKTCVEGKLIQKSLRKLLDDIETTAAGSAAGIIVVVCKDKK